MSKTYIVGYDGSEASRAAVRFTDALAAATGAQTTVAAVYPDPPFTYGRGGAAIVSRQALIDASRHGAEETLDTLGEGPASRATIMADSAPHGLQRLADARGASLLAVGVTHQRGAGRLVPGSVADHLLHGSPCPVLVVPPAAESEPEIGSIGVAYDLRPEAQAALDHAVTLAQQLGARLTLISVHVPSLSHGAAGVPATSYDLEEGGRAALEERVMQKADELPPEVAARVRVVAGPPAALLEEVGREGIDLLVTGSRGYGPLKSVLLGSVSRHVVDHATCPVLVVPRSSAVEAGEPLIATAVEA